MKDSVGTSKVKATSPIVEVFSALSQGNRPTVDGKVVDKAVAYIKELAGRAIDGDHQAVSELNAIQRFTIEPKLIEAIKIFNFMVSIIIIRLIIFMLLLVFVKLKMNVLVNGMKE